MPKLGYFCRIAKSEDIKPESCYCNWKTFEYLTLTFGKVIVKFGTDDEHLSNVMKIGLFVLLKKSQQA